MSRWRASWLVVSWLGLTACSAVVGGPAVAPEDVPCEVIDGYDPCGAGRACVDGRCVGVGDPCDGIDNDLDEAIDEGSDTEGACAMATEVCVDGMCVPGMPETCNDLDDDRDGAVDEDLDVDLDGDLFTTCGMDPAMRDCVDRPGVGESINPGAVEVCDGYDNDCNPATPDPSCGADQVCATPIGADRPECLDRMSCRLTGCGTGERCDGTSDRCAAISDCRMPGMECPIGQVCEVPVEGGSPVCRMSAPGAIGALCTDGTQCGSGVCMPFSALRITPTAGALGVCGAACCNHADCASFGADLVCLAPGTGARSCVTRDVAGEAADVPLCVGAGCTGERCRLASASTGSSRLFSVFSCGPDVGDQDAFCFDDSDCRSGVCSGGLCRNACGSRAGCVFGCIYVSAPPSDWVTVCGVHGDVEAGGACTGNGDCLEGYCDPAAPRVCRGTCCADRQCPGGRCVPVDNAGWEMRCMPGAPPG